MSFRENTRLQTIAAWERISTSGASTPELHVHTFRRPWYTRSINVGDLSEAIYNYTTDIQEYVYLLVHGTDVQALASTIGHLKNLIDESILAGKPPRVIDYTPSESGTSYIIRHRSEPEVLRPANGSDFLQP